ncbi:MAG: hypothetical protein ABJA50_02180 [Chloroflexota bacterium]
MKDVMRNPRNAVALSLLAPLVVLLVAWLAPLPRLVLGEEEAAATRMPQTRTDTARAKSNFEQVQTGYKDYLAAHDVGAALSSLESSAAALQVDPTSAELLSKLQSAVQPVQEFAAQLQAYADGGGAYFAQAKHYDDELMAWTRSLGADSESLRPDTWPIVEYLKLYPPPAGEKADYANVSAADVGKLEVALDGAAVTLTDKSTLVQYQATIADLKSAGRSIEYIEGLHSQYFTLLQNYDTKLQAVASGSEASNLSGSRTIIATATNLLVGAALVVGLVAIFLPRGRKENEVAA